MESLTLDVHSPQVGRRLLELVTSCPILRAGKLGVDLELCIPAEARLVSNLETSNLELNDHFILKLDSSFSRWIGDKLSDFNIFTSHQLPLDQAIFHSTLNASSFSLKSVFIHITSLAPLKTQVHLDNLHLPTLRSVTVSGNLQMINFFTQIS